MGPGNHESILLDIARRAMVEKGLEPDFPAEALRQLEGIREPAPPSPSLEDLTGLPWCSIDNDDSLDIDQLSASRDLGSGVTRVWVAVADVDALVAKGTPIDHHAGKNTTSVYTGVRTFPMLPEKLSNGLTSLNQDEDRQALVVEMDVDPEGKLSSERVLLGRVRNKAKLAYHGVGAWLEGKGELPEAAAKVPELAQQLKSQDAAAQRLREHRYHQGALDLETLQPRPSLKEGKVESLELEAKNRAGELIEDFMVAANGVTARFLERQGFPSLRRVVRTPQRWNRIVSVAETLGEKLPGEPDSGALNAFLTRQRKKDPLRFPDLSLTVVKLLGRGEYLAQGARQAPAGTAPNARRGPSGSSAGGLGPAGTAPNARRGPSGSSAGGLGPAGHFGLAVRDYNHSTAPNRRYPDLLTHRLLKAALAGAPSPYTLPELSFLGSHCTVQENNADKVERRVRKSASALFLSDRIGDHFDALVTGASEKGTWVRTLRPAVEGKLVHGWQGLDVGDRVRVKLISVNVEMGYIDFVKTG